MMRAYADAALATMQLALRTTWRAMKSVVLLAQMAAIAHALDNSVSPLPPLGWSS